MEKLLLIACSQKIATSGPSLELYPVLSGLSPAPCAVRLGILMPPLIPAKFCCSCAMFLEKIKVKSMHINTPQPFLIQFLFINKYREIFKFEKFTGIALKRDKGYIIFFGCYFAPFTIYQS